MMVSQVYSHSRSPRSLRLGCMDSIYISGIKHPRRILLSARYHSPPNIHGQKRCADVKMIRSQWQWK